MTASYSFDVDPARDLVRITMGGLFTPGDVEGFQKARNDAHAQLRCPRNQHLTINDLRAMKIQPQESVDAFGRLLGDPAHRSRRLAFVIGRTLARKQLLRALSGRGAHCCETLEEAEAWVFDDAPAGTVLGGAV